MKKLLVIIIVSFFTIYSLQAQKYNKKTLDTKTQKEILIGKCNLKGLKTGEFGDILRVEYKYYIPDSNIIGLLQPKLKNIKIIIVMGSWCGDSREQVPRFIKILDVLKFKYRKINFLCVDRLFKEEHFDKKITEINKVPTFIIYRKNKEIGRIIESPMQNLEKDLLNILNKPNQTLNASKAESN